MAEFTEKTTCYACSFVITKPETKNRFTKGWALMKLNTHVKKNHNILKDGYKCKNKKCRRKSFKDEKSGKPTNQTCKPEKLIWRIEDIKEHITETEHQKNRENDHKVQARKQKSLTCQFCSKVFKHSGDRKVHERDLICK